MRIPKDGKRCTSVSPVSGLRCARHRRHNQEDREVTHVCGMTTWGPGFLGATQDDDLLGEGLPTYAQDTGVMFDAAPSPQQQLTQWWMNKAQEEIDRTVAKAIEYSATDLIDIGRDMARIAGREVDDTQAAELGVLFYARGKLARWVGAAIEGLPVSADTLHDLGVYCRMAQRIREVGSWPGVENLDG